jgi:hypothetical protein
LRIGLKTKSKILGNINFRFFSWRVQNWTYDTEKRLKSTEFYSFWPAKKDLNRLFADEGDNIWPRARFFYFYFVSMRFPQSIDILSAIIRWCHSLSLTISFHWLRSVSFV